MRLDKYLKNARLIKRRTIANEACTQGRVLLNGKAAKPAAEVREGDELELHFGARTLRCRILHLDEHPAKADAADMYELLEGGI